MRKYILLCLLFGWAILSNAQTITIKDLETLKPIELVTLMSENPSAYAVTNAHGQADISAFKDAEKIEIRMVGYKSLVKSYAELGTLNFQIGLAASNLNLDEVVISGTRWKQSSNNIPAKIVTITAKEVALQNPQTAADLLSLSGKVYIQKSQQGGGSPMIRGFATNRLLYNVDGVRMNSAIFRGGNLQNVINLDPFAIEKTEVLFGPGSVMYGSDAIGGVMSFQTLMPQLSLTDQTLITGKALTRFSSANNEKTGHFDVNVGWKKWAFVSSISSWDFDNLRQGRNGPSDYIKPIYVETVNGTDNIVTQQDPLLQIPSAYSQINMMQKIRFSPNKAWDFQYGFHYSETSPYGRYDRNNRYKKGTLRYAEWFYGPQKWMMNNLSISHKGNNVVYDELVLRLAQQSFEESRMDRSLNDVSRTVNKEHVEAYSINLDLSKSIAERHKLTYGTEFILNDIKSLGSITNTTNGLKVAGPSRYPNSTWSSLAAYFNDEFKISEKLTALAGVRYNQYAIDADFTKNLPYYPLPFASAKLDKGSLTGSIGAVYRPSKSWVVSINLGTGFRSPNVDDIGKIFDSEAGGVTVPNPDLEAEYAYNLDLGVAKVFGDFMKIDITGFYTSLQNAMVKRNFQLNGLDSIIYNGQMSSIQAIQNAAVATVYGLQASLEIKLPHGFSISSSLNWQVGQEELDDKSTSSMRHAPPLYGVSRLNFSEHKLHLQLYSSYMAERKFVDLPFEEQTKIELYAKDKDGNNYAPAWYTINFKAEYDLNETFTITTGIENITDQRYRPYSSGISAPGRNFILSVRANF